VNNATIYYQIKDKDLALEPAVLKKVNAFIAKFEDKKYPLTFSALWRVKSLYQDNEPRNYWVFWGNASLDIDLDKGNKIIARQSSSSAQVDKKLVNKAANAINQLSREGKINLVRIERVKDEVAGSYFWHFEDHYDHHSVKIDAITNQVLKVDTIYTDWTSDKDFAISFAKPKYTPKQAILQQAVKLNLYSMSIWPDIKLPLNWMNIHSRKTNSLQSWAKSIRMGNFTPFLLRLKRERYCQQKIKYKTGRLW